jgi:hypothetical protein
MLESFSHFKLEAKTFMTDWNQMRWKWWNCLLAFCTCTLKISFSHSFFFCGEWWTLKWKCNRWNKSINFVFEFYVGSDGNLICSASCKFWWDFTSELSEIKFEHILKWLNILWNVKIFIGKTIEVLSPFLQLISPKKLFFLWFIKYSK